MKHVKTQIELELSINERNNELQTKFENLERQGSGLVLKKIMSMQIKIYKTNPLIGGTYKELPIDNQAILNIENSDMSCAIWSILAKMFPATANQD